MCVCMCRSSRRSMRWPSRCVLCWVCLCVSVSVSDRCTQEEYRQIHRSTHPHAPDPAEKSADVSALYHIPIGTLSPGSDSSSPLHTHLPPLPPPRPPHPARDTTTLRSEISVSHAPQPARPQSANHSGGAGLPTAARR